MPGWTFTDADQELMERWITPFLPDHIFDAHAHLFRVDHFAPDAVPDHLRGAPPQLGLAEYRHYIEWIHPRGRTVGGLFFGLAFTGRREANNAFVAEQVANDPAAFGQMIVSPEMEPDYVRQEVKRGNFVGLKCYHTMARTEGPTWQAPIEIYLPEDHVRIAHGEGLSITLHMVRERALADPVNQQTIRRYCERYPNMRLILAHAARGFNPWHTIEGIQSLQGISNVWFDTSAVTEAGAFEAIVETMGHERLLYGTDFHVSHLRGRCVAIGDSFHWIYADEMDVDERHTHLRPVLIGIESLRSLLLACRRLKLSDRHIEDLFFGNAQQLWDVPVA
jgi:predicted TIM-barrel fold metal-dependent hydrolase